MASGARLATTSRPSLGVYRIWARRNDGHLVRLTLDSDDDEYSEWKDLFSAVYPSEVGPKGVDGVSWLNSAGQEEEHVAYVGADNKIYDWRLLDGASSVTPYRSIPAPAGESLTGHIAIGRRQGTVFLFASTNLGRLYRWEITNWNSGGYRQWAPLTGVSTTSMITATGPTSGAYVRVFFSNSNGTIRQYKWDGVSWTSTSFAGPGGTAAPCALAAATEGSLSTNAYRTYLFCTRGGTGYDTTLYYTYAPNLGGSVFEGWSSEVVPAGSVATTGFGLTARRRAESGQWTLEAFLTGTQAENRLFHVEHTAWGDGLGDITELGRNDETTSCPGGIVAAGRDARGYSDAFYVGKRDSASWLYRKIGDDDGNGAESDWVNYGPAEGWKIYREGTALNGPSPTESSTSIFGGRVLVAAMYRDSVSIEGTHVLWSVDEGDNFGAQMMEVAEPPNPPSWCPGPGPCTWTWGDAFDPCTDFDDSGKGYITVQRNVRDGEADAGSAILLHSTTGAAVDFELEVYGSSVAADHPWMAVARNPDGVDEIHIVWVEKPSPFRYTHAPVNDLEALQANVVVVDSGTADPSVPRMVLTDTPWIVWPHGVCKLHFEDGEADGSCDGLHLFHDDLTPDSANSDDGHELEFPHTDNTFRATRSFSAVADPMNPNKVYYAFQKREPGVPDGEGPMDMYVASLSYWFGAIDPGPRHPLSTLDDGIHQAMPELTVSQDGPSPEDFLVATWYDWKDVYCWIEGVGYFDGSDWDNAACYEVNLAYSNDFGNSWHTVPHLFPTVSDPGLLPERNPGGTPFERFIGDYHAVNGGVMHGGSPLTGVIHSVHVAITAPVGGDDEVTNIERGWASHGYWENSL